MNLFRSTLAGAAAAVLVASQPAIAVPRVSAATGESDELAGYPGAAPVIGVIAVVGLISLLMLIDDGNDDDRPASP